MERTDDDARITPIFIANESSVKFPNFVIQDKLQNNCEERKNIEDSFVDISMRLKENDILNYAQLQLSSGELAKQYNVS